MTKWNMINALVYSKTVRILLLISLGIFIVLLLWFYRQMNFSQKQRFLSYVVADELRQSSDDLTRMVRTYVMTNNPKFENMYWDILKIRNGQKPRPVRYESIYWDFMAYKNEKPRADGEKIALLQMMKDLDFMKEELTKLNQALSYSNDLVRTEMKAMQAMKGIYPDKNGEFTVKGEPNYEYARSILYDEEYHKNKMHIMTSIDEVFMMVNARTEASVNRNKIITTILIILVVLTMSLILLLTICELADYKEMTITLENKNIELERFNYTVSHDLKTPIVTIKGFIGLLGYHIAGGNKEDMKSDLGRISSAADQMSKLLEGLLEISRIGRKMNPSQDISLFELTNEILGLFTISIEDKNIQVNVSPDLPVVYGDHQRFFEIMQNLIGNSIKYMGNQPKPQIEIGVYNKSDETIIYVKDNGIGIDPKYHERVFGLFNQLHRHHDGTGIGLAIVKRIVEFYGGRIWIESEGEGKGTTFCFTLPAQKDSTQNKSGDKEHSMSNHMLSQMHNN